MHFPRPCIMHAPIAGNGVVRYDHHDSPNGKRRKENAHMTTVRMISDAEATGLVREVYDDIKATKGIDFVPNFWRALAVNPEHLSATWHKLKETMAAGALDPLTKELIAIAVSATNGCRYCINSHTGAAIKLGMDTRMFSELLAVVDVFNGTNRLADAYQVEPDAYPEVPPPK